MLDDHPLNSPNQTLDYQTGDEMMCCCGILIEQPWSLMLQPIEGLMCSGKDGVQSYLILLLKLLHEDWNQRLLNQDHCSPLCLQHFGVQIQS